jgi:hypothetical protein
MPPMGGDLRTSARLARLWSGASRRERLVQALALQRVQAEGSSPRAAGYLDAAGHALAQGDLNGAWEGLFAAQEQEPFRLKEPLLTLRARELQAEADAKLAGHWRGVAIAALLGWSEDGPLPLAEKQERLSRAMRLRNEHSANTYRRLDTTRGQLVLLAAVATLIVVVLTALLASGAIPLGDGDELDADQVVGVALFGALGGAFSGAISLLRAAPKPIPQALVEGWTTLARPVVGAVGALAAFAFLVAGVLGIDGAAAAYAVAFAAGFSERLVSRAAESLAG